MSFVTMVSKSAGVPVQGVCGRGHAVKTVAAAGRVTWKGECPGEGGQPCGAYVICRRIPLADRNTPEPSSPPAGGAAPAKPTKRIRKVAAYRDDNPGFQAPGRARNEPGGHVDDDGGGTGDGGGGGGSPRVRPAPAGDVTPTPVERPAGPDEHEGDQARGGFFKRFGQAVRAEFDDEGTIPGIY